MFERLGGKRHGAFLIGKAQHEHIGRDGVAEQRRGDRARIDEAHLVGTGCGRDGAFDARGGEREIGVAREVARQELGRVDDEAGGAAAHGGEHLLGAGDHEVASENEIGIARRDPDRVDVLLALREAHMAVDRAALLGEAGHVDHAATLVLEMGRHAENRADGDDARAADAGHDDRVSLLGERRQVGLREM